MNDEHEAIRQLNHLIGEESKKRGIKKNRACAVLGVSISKSMKRAVPYGYKTVMLWANGNHGIKGEVSIAIDKLYARITRPPAKKPDRHRVTINAGTPENKAYIQSLPEGEALRRMLGGD